METTAPCQKASSFGPDGRRWFLRWLTGIFGTVAATVVSVPLVGYFFGVRRPKESWVDLGSVTDFPMNETRRLTFDNPLRQPWDGMTALTIVYARYEGTNDAGTDQFLVLSAHCAHLGCPVTWFPQSGLFMCPCHGGVYYANGERASGPPPRGLFHCNWRVQDDRLQIQAPHYPTLQDTLVPPHRETA
ncbi:MAG: ubiquinol-cytochrome c reductase iron-sulfur subunit [Pirellulales bacterium]